MAEMDTHVRSRFLNGDIKMDSYGENHTSPFRNPLKHQVNLQRIRDRAQKLQTDLIDQMSRELESLFEEFVSEVEQIEQNPESLFEVGHKSNRERRKDGELPEKVFVNRRSVLTCNYFKSIHLDYFPRRYSLLSHHFGHYCSLVFFRELLEISHIRTIYHIFVAILLVFSLNTIVYDIIDKGRVVLDFDLIQWAFGKFPKVMALWVCMQLSTLLILYPGFYHWSTSRRHTNSRVMDFTWLGIFIIYQIAFLVLPVSYLSEHNLPPASAVIIVTEQLRLMMKVHSFVRESAYRVIKPKKTDDNEDGNCPDFSKYLYFLFSPTLIYRDHYPRTQKIHWNYVVSNFAQVLACLFYTYYIFERFCVPVFRNFNREHVTPKALLLSVFGCMLPGTLVLFIGFFAILHSWLNAFAEMLRFGDRLFYKDWWNSTTFSNYYRTWNVVVHDWLYTYIYKDVYNILGPSMRSVGMTSVFFISAIFHEYVLVVSFGFFYPVLFVMFAGAGFGFVFLTDKGVSRSWNVFMWVSLFIGNGLLMCLYSLEWYARQNCPVTANNFFDYLIPRSWTCDFAGITLK